MGFLCDASGDWSTFGRWTHSRRDGQRDLIAFLSRRGPDFLSKFEKMEAVEVKHLCPGFPSTGTLLYMRIRGTPNPFETPPPEGKTWGCHATSPYCIRRIIAGDSLAVGMAALSEGEKEITGVFYHQLDRMHGCQATYGHYVSFTGKGYFFAPFVMISSDLDIYRADGKREKTVVRVTQRLTLPGCHKIVGVLWHMVHSADLLQAPASVHFMCEAAWTQGGELSPNDRWEDILRKSEEASLSVRSLKPSGDKAKKRRR